MHKFVRLCKVNLFDTFLNSAKKLILSVKENNYEK
jgi:hypothetical protein